MILLFPTLIDFENPDDRKNFDVSCHMFYPRRVMDINDGKPKWTGLNDASELCADSPKEAVEKRKADLEQEHRKKMKGEQDGEVGK